MLFRTTDNRLIWRQKNQECEILPFVNANFLLELKKELLLIEQAYYCEVIGGCPYIFLEKDEYRVLGLLRRHYSCKQIAKIMLLKIEEVEQIWQKLRQKYILWAHDSKFIAKSELAMIKVLVEGKAFSELIDADDYESFLEMLPNDKGFESRRAWGELESLDILQILTSAQKKTAVLLEQGYGPEEIAKKLGVSKQEVYQKIARIRKTLIQAGYADGYQKKKKGVPKQPDKQNQLIYPDNA